MHYWLPFLEVTSKPARLIRSNSGLDQKQKECTYHDWGECQFHKFLAQMVCYHIDSVQKYTQQNLASETETSLIICPHPDTHEVAM